MECEAISKFGPHKGVSAMEISNEYKADFLRNGTAKVVMSLSKDDSTQLWQSVEKHDLPMFNAVNQKLLNPQGSTLRHLPVKLYLPHAAPGTTEERPTPGSLRVVQALVTPALSSRESSLFGSSRF